MSYELPNVIAPGDRRDIEPIMGNFTDIASALSDATDDIISLQAATASVNGSTLVDASVGTAKLTDSAVTTAKILDENVTNGKLADGILPVANKILSSGFSKTSVVNEEEFRIQDSGSSALTATITPTRDSWAVITGNFNLTVTSTSASDTCDGFTCAIKEVTGDSDTGTVVGAHSSGWWTAAAVNTATRTSDSMSFVIPLQAGVEKKYGLVGYWRCPTQASATTGRATIAVSATETNLSIVLLPR